METQQIDAWDKSYLDYTKQPDAEDVAGITEPAVIALIEAGEIRITKNKRMYESCWVNRLAPLVFEKGQKPMVRCFHESVEACARQYWRLLFRGHDD